MPILEERKLHGRDEIVSAMSAAGQFAHIDPDAFEPWLNALWRPDVRLVPGMNGRWWAGNTAEAAVPFVLFQAHQAGFVSRECYASETVDYIAENMGVCCCLCLEIEKQAPTSYGWVSAGLIEFFCPTYLRVESASRMPSGAPAKGLTSQPLCQRCRQSMERYLWRIHGKKLADDMDEIYYVDAMTYIYGFHGFKQRVERNAGNLSLLRFDPRKAA